MAAATAHDPARPPGLSVEKITGAALEIIRSVGVDGLTMRLLAEELGVTVAATYRHVQNREALLELVLDSALSTIQAPERSVGSPLERLAVIGSESFREILAHPGLDALVVRSQRHTPHTRRLREVTIGLLIEAGFDRDTAKRVEEVRHRLWLGSVAVATATAARLQADAAGPRKVNAERLRSNSQLAFAMHLLDAGMRSLLADARFGSQAEHEVADN